MRKRCRRQRMATCLSRLTKTTLLVGYLVTLLGLPLSVPTPGAPPSDAASAASHSCGCPPKLIRLGRCCCQAKVAPRNCCGSKRDVATASSCCSRRATDDRPNDEPPAEPLLTQCGCGSSTFHGYLVSRDPRIPPQPPLLCEPACDWQSVLPGTPLKVECIRQPDTPPPQSGMDLLCS